MEQSNKMNELGDFLLESAKELKGVTVAEWPELCRQIVVWEFWSNVTIAAFLVVLTIGMSVGIRVLWGKMIADEKLPIGEQSGDIQGMCFASCVIMSLGSVGCVIGAIVCAVSALKAHTAPYLVLIETLKGIV